MPQGSHLGPIQFNIFINDIVSNCNDVKFALFADDLKIFRVVSSIDDCNILQRAVSDVSRWCDFNGMELNVSKCHVVSFSRSDNIISFDYNIKDEIIVHKPFIRDLGVIFDQKVSFIPHIEKIICKAMQMLGFLKRITVDFKQLTPLKILYISFVRFHLEFCSNIWSPYYIH